MTTRDGMMVRKARKARGELREYWYMRGLLAVSFGVPFGPREIPDLWCKKGT
jgi:hypothetical protein